MKNDFEKKAFISVKEFFSKKKMQKDAQKLVFIGLLPEETVLIEKFFSKKKSSVLVIGCSAGRESISLGERSFLVTGIDFSPKLLKMAAKNAEKKNVKVNFAYANTLQLPFKNNSFDCALMLLKVFDYVPKKKNRVQTLKEIQRVLKKNGVLIFDTANFSLKSELTQIALFLLFPLMDTKKFFKEAKKSNKSPLKYYVRAYFNPMIKKEIFKVIKRNFWTKPVSFVQEKILKSKNIEFGDAIISANKLHPKKNHFYHFHSSGEIKKLVELSGLKHLDFFCRKELLNPKGFISRHKIFKNFDTFHYHVAKKQ